MTDTEKVRDFQRKLYRKAKQEKDFRFYVLYDKVCSLRFLREAYKRVKANKRNRGADHVSSEDIERKGTEEFLREIAEELRTETYRPTPVLRVYIEKADGGMRPLGIPSIRDRVVRMACETVIEPIFEADFEAGSYGFRPKRGAEDAVVRIKKNLKNGASEVSDADITAYSDAIPHDKLMKLIGMRVSDSKVPHLIKMWLKTPICEERYMRERKITEKSENKIREKLRTYFKRCRHYATENVVGDVNLMIRGWVNYFHIPKVSYARKNGAEIL